jgi:hypothetical protein
MKKKCIIVSVLFLLLTTGGCWESLALIGGGAAGGMTITRVLDQQQQVIQEDISLMEAQKAELEKKLAETTDEVERAKIQEQLKNTETVLDDLKTADEAIAMAKEGLNVNWQDPQSIIPYAATVLMTVFGIMQRRKRRTTETALAEVVAGGQAFKKTADADTLKEFKEAQKLAQKSPDTKKMVAILRV